MKYLILIPVLFLNGCAAELINGCQITDGKTSGGYFTQTDTRFCRATCSETLPADLAMEYKNIETGCVVNLK